jgi:ketosteroid isomerase-like protein
MKPTLIILAGLLLNTSCHRIADKEEIKQEIFQTEKAFEKMAAEKSVAEAFYYFADEKAVIKRENDTLIIGKENIKTYYDQRNNENAIVNWTPDFTAVSDCGTLGYTYGKYVWKIKNEDGDTLEYKGVFHTVWKKQHDGTWKYVWD